MLFEPNSSSLNNPPDHLWRPYAPRKSGNSTPTFNNLSISTTTSTTTSTSSSTSSSLNISKSTSTVGSSLTISSSKSSNKETRKGFSISNLFRKS